MKSLLFLVLVSFSLVAQAQDLNCFHVEGSVQVAVIPRAPVEEGVSVAAVRIQGDGDVSPFFVFCDNDLAAACLALREHVGETAYFRGRLIFGNGPGGSQLRAWAHEVGLVGDGFSERKSARKFQRLGVAPALSGSCGGKRR